MPAWWTVDLRCEECSHKWDILVEREKRKEAHEVVCPSCKAEQVLTESFPGPSVSRESLLDGQRRKNDGDYGRMRDAVKLERQAYNKPYDSKERKELMGAAQKLKEGKLP